MKPGIQSPERTLKIATGSCRDSAWLLCQLLRHCGLATRFVSGYLIQLVADKEAVDGPSGPKQDFTDLHAWCEVYLPGAGWVGLDPTSGLLAGEGHIPLACSPVPSDAAPITGAHEKARVTFKHEMSVERLLDSGRPLKPYEEETWSLIHETGHQVDALLRENDVRLTTGGEPTFVGTKNPDADEWNTAALGSEKHVLADQLLHRLQHDWAPGALLHHGQGKWYPGEELPRWAYQCYWRDDGEDIWENPQLFERNDNTQRTHRSVSDAERLIQLIAQNCAIDDEFAFPAYEDPWHLAWQARRFPSNKDPLTDDLKEDSHQKRLVSLLRGEPRDPVAMVLPLIDAGPQQWKSGEWFLREERCYLMPGDSPAGFRLPLDGLPWEAKEKRQGAIPDYYAMRALLPRAKRVKIQMQHPQDSSDDMEPDDVLPDPDIVRTALVIEPRDGILRVFLPPIAEPDAWLDLIQRIEMAVQDAGLTVQFEGYEAPKHPRIKRMALTPDPGVLEVNVPPVDSWDAFVRQTKSLYDHAHQLYLAAEKFDYDGRHTGTGGGCHVTIGGPSPSESPVLRRPDLLKSLLTCFNNHPSLSYVFSGNFIGPTSQAPRIDEARQDSIAELELALAQIPQAGQDCPPWLVDRLLRNILTDVTGNTHRTECCIDKLYSPDHSAGRQGLVEFRSFEMPPHWQLNCAQQLLIRSLVAYYWLKPNEQPLAHWGTRLHDKWMLPWYLKQDLQEVCQQLGDIDIAMDPKWFQPHIDFRMPLLGAVEKDGVCMEVRQAIEPWHVLGEEPGAGAQARYVDSSLERVEILVHGLTDRRHAIACNGYEVPLQPTGVAGESVAGIRYRAWQPPHCLHPTIGVDVPLHIDLYDRWNKRAIAAASIHVAHPGGRSYDSRPVNANEAEGRRLLMFRNDGHSQGSYEINSTPALAEQPHTLDMRRFG